MPDQKRKEFQKLVDKYLNGTATPEEQQAIDRYYLLFRDEPEDAGLLTEEQLLALEERMESGLFKRIRQPVKVKRLWPRIAAAASIVLAISAGGYFLLHKPVKQQQTAQNQIHDIAPGHNRATLTLANGQKIILTKGMKGQLAQGISVNPNAIVYQAAEKIEYNTLTTKRGEASPYPLELPDGSKVWLNAASSTTFPTGFTKDRIVTITGEAYFEVKHDANHPFTVKAGSQTIEDIGTSFDVNSYSDEPAEKTTLVEGSVSINHQIVLKPGQESLLADNKLSIANANIATALAWKNGQFNFDNADVPSVMRQIARWYDVDVEYEGGVPNAQINGAVYRNTNASNALKIVKLLGIPYRIEGRKIIITNK